MTVESSKNKSGPFIATGSSGTFPRDFLLLDESHLRVIRNRAGIESDLTSGFTQSGIGEAEGAVMIATGIAAGDEIILLRAVPMVQRSDYNAQGRVLTEQVERDLDLLEMQVQDVSERVNRQLTIPPSFDGDTEEILSDIINAAAYSEAAQQAAATAIGVPTYASFDDAESASVSVFANVVGIPGAQFERSATDVVLTTADGSTWKPAGVLTPFHFRAIPWDMTTDQSARFNEMSDWLRARYDASAGAFKWQIDLCGVTWRCDSWNLTNIRQPAFSFGNGTIVSYGTGRIVVDCSGTNHARIFGEFSIEAPLRASAPAVGMCIGRAAFGSSPTPIAPDWAGRVRVDGYFSKAAFVNIASEVSRLQLHLTNRARSLTAVCLAHVGHMGTIDEFLGGLTSEYVTLPTAADGGMSNILHDYGQLICKRGSDVSLPILGLSRTNPCVVTVDPTLLASSAWVVGTVLYFHDHGGMPELKYRTVTIRSINTSTGEIALNEAGGSTPVNATGYSAWTGGGRVWTATGPAMLLGAARGVRTSASYMLTYGSPSIIMDCSRGTIGDIVLDLQQEASPPTVVRAHTGSASCLIQGFKLNILNANQTPVDSFMRLSPDGTLRIDNFEMTIHGAYTGSPSGGIIGGIGNLTLRNAFLRIPLAADAQWSGYTFFSGVIACADPVVMRTIYNNVYGASATAAQLQNITSQINTVGKFEGLPVWATDADRIVFAAGATASATWRAADGTLVYTPA